MDFSEPPRNGAVVRYAYLWKDEARRGLEEGRKDRPAAVILAHRESPAGPMTVLVLPITRAPPADPRTAIEIPPDAKRILRLDDAPSWIVCSEVNRFLWPGFDLRPVPDQRPATPFYGMLPRGLWEQARQRFLALRKEGLAKAEKRD